MRFIIIIGLFAACYQSPSRNVEDGGPVDPRTDIIIDVPSPDASSMRFSPPRLVSELNTALDERSAALADAGNALYFARTEVVSGFNVNVPYVARRANTSSQFRPAVRAAAFGTTSISDFEMADDELEWLYWRGLGQLATSTRPNSDDGWSAPVELGFDGLSPSLSSSGNRLYYVALEGTVQVRARTNRSSPWQAPRTEPIPFAGRIRAVDISRDSLFLLITASSGVFIARRDSEQALFETPALLFAGDFENARFGSSDALISLIDVSGPDRQIAIATAQ